RLREPIPKGAVREASLRLAMTRIIKAQACEALCAGPVGQGAGLGARHLRLEAAQPQDARLAPAITRFAQVCDAPRLGSGAHKHELRSMIVHPMKPCRCGPVDAALSMRPCRCGPGDGGRGNG